MAEVKRQTSNVKRQTSNVRCETEKNIRANLTVSSGAESPTTRITS